MENVGGLSLIVALLPSGAIFLDPTAGLGCFTASLFQLLNLPPYRKCFLQSFLH